MRLCRTLLCLGIIIGLPSVWETLAFSWNPDFQAPRLALGPTHTNYHAFREFTLTIGAELVMLYVVFQPAGHRIRPPLERNAYSRSRLLCRMVAALAHFRISRPQRVFVN